MSHDDNSARDLAAFANAAGQPNQPSGHALVRPTSGIAERVIGAQPVAVYRDELKVIQKLKMLAAAAGSDWFYRFPVKKKDGGQDWIEGPSIKLANEVHRVFGNAAAEVREIDVGDAWVFYARHTDFESGSSMERAYRQRKSQGSIRSRDTERQLDIAYQIGQSKAIRNVICNHLQIYCDIAFEEARNSLIEKIGKDLDGWRERTLQRLAKMPVELSRVERVIGRPAKDWLAPNIAQVIAMAKSIVDGMASIDDVFPPPESIEAPAAPPRRGEGDGEQSTSTAPADSRDTPTPPVEREQSAVHSEARDSAAVDPLTAALAMAHELGRQAKERGTRRAALPGEYRDSARSKEADAWLAGWDGKPVPLALK